jgi:hypothetical protein
MASGVITTGSNPKLLWPGLQDIWGLEYDTYQPQWKPLFDMHTSDKKYEEDVGMTGMGLAPVKPEGSSLEYDTQKQTFVSRYTNIAYSIGFIVTREELSDCQYSEVAPQRLRQIMYSMHQTKENVGANIYNRAFNPAYPGGDNVSLINSAHPTEGGTLSNTLTTPADLSEAALEDAIIDIQQFRDNRNNLISIQPKMLIVPPGLQFEATRILKNPQRPGTANRDISALNYSGWLQDIVINQYFVDSDAWFIKTNCPTGLKYYERETARLEQDNEFDTKNGKYSGYERYSVGWSDWRGLYGSPGA